MSSATDKTLWDSGRLNNPHGEPDKARRVQHMFDQIAPTYELVNRVMSAGRDSYWRKRAVALAKVGAADRVLDLACGTGDFSRAFAEASPAVTVGSDFSEGMLSLAAQGPGGKIDWCRADAQRLPFADGSFSVVSCAFGVRNFQDLHRGFTEMHRVLAPSGRAVILEFTMPRSRIFGSVYSFYFRRVMPRIARMISRDSTGAYDYLPHSVSSFVNAEGMRRALQDAGFATVTSRTLTMGIVTVYIAAKP